MAAARWRDYALMMATTMSPTVSSLRWQPLAIGQIWTVGELRLHIRHVGPSMVSYFVTKAGSVRKRSQVQSKSSMDEYLKKNRAILIQSLN